METSSCVQADLSGPVATLTLNRPDRLNAMTVEMDRQLRAAFDTASGSPQCRVIIIRGAGRGFCSGADRDTAGGTQSPLSWQPCPARLAEFRFGYLLESPKPVIAAIHGAAIGVGLVLAACCDIRLATCDAKLGFPYSRLGLVAEYGIAHLLPALLGSGIARELLLSGRLFSGTQALDMGLASHVADADAFDALVREYAEDLARNCSPRSMAVIKNQLRDAAQQTFIESLHRANRELDAARQSSDYAEARAARRDRRPPAFTGD
ncbi:enoyl-CoA hydratase-related protein [Pigmentiphaga sp. YJ18]|uniref:enoyl-CoA hydratase-related protein n=1 Tax=Pigmentiphaga sp. YJ18 TaxID=3134907 RepID=UPI0031129851